MTARPDLVLETAGHIDHGKTALVRALTGVDTDRLPAEKARGITIDLGFAALDLDAARLAVVDVPGHERYVRNMLAGASGMDLAMLVVAADDSVMPQTREHLEILNLLGVRSGLIALTKCDLADPSWTAMVADEIRGLVAGSFLDRAEIVRTSARTGAGIDDLRAALAKLASAAIPPPDPGPFRLAIDRSFTLAGLGTIVTGTVASGAVGVGDELQWWPEGRSVRVKGLHRHDRAVERAGRGARAAINLAGVHHSEVERGQVLATPGYLAASRVLSVSLVASLDAPRPLRHRGRYRLHLGTAEVAATLALLDETTLAPGERAKAQFFLAEPVAATAGQPFILREESPAATLGGGRILQATPKRMRRRDLSARTLLETLDEGGPVDRLRAALAGFGLASRNDLALARESAVPVAEIPGLLANLAHQGILVDLAIGPRRTLTILAEVVAELEDRVGRALGRLHDDSPRQTAIRRSHLLAALPDLPGKGVVAAILARLEAQGRVIGDLRTVALREFEPKLSHTERKLKARFAEDIRGGGFAPPHESELAAGAKGRSEVVPELLAILAAEGEIVAIGGGLHLDIACELALRERVAQYLQANDSMTMADLRDLLGTTRKYAVPIGEYLDRIGLTRRDGDLRRLGLTSPLPETSYDRVPIS